MKNTIIATTLAALALLFGAVSTMAADATAAEAKAMLEKAIAALKANQATAIANFNKADGGFRDRDLYVFCWDTASGKFSAHVNPALVGTDIRALKEPSGSPLGQKIFDAVKEGQIVTVDYQFPRPGTTQPVPKQSYIEKVGATGCGVGYYKT